jgi:hypothetical protein
MLTKVVHCRRSKYDVYIGRPGKWGNPFKLKAGESREEAVAKYRAWLMKQTKLLACLHELRGKTLGCWCKPQLCHGDVLAELADAEFQTKVA